MAKEKTLKTLNILSKSNSKQTQFNYEESFRHIRANIEFSNMDKPIHSFIVTSTQANEAKTTVAINLAYIFAVKYAKVLVIDCDLRKHQLNQYMNLSNYNGLIDALKEYGTSRKINQEYIQRVTDDSFSGVLHVLTAGTSVPNPSEVLSSNLFKMFLEEIKSMYDYVIIDCPPIGMVTDAIPIGLNTDGAVFIVSAKDTNRKDAAECVTLLKRNNVHIIGSIITKTEVSHGSYYYNYY